MPASKLRPRKTSECQRIFRVAKSAAGPSKRIVEPFATGISRKHMGMLMKKITLTCFVGLGIIVAGAVQTTLRQKRQTGTTVLKKLDLSRGAHSTKGQ